MRGENEMLDLIISTARTDTTCSFIRDTSWMNAFGRVALMQEQDSDFGYGERFGIRSKYDESYSWLLLFDDGNRIDI